MFRVGVNVRAPLWYRWKQVPVNPAQVFILYSHTFFLLSLLYWIEVYIKTFLKTKFYFQNFENQDIFDNNDVDPAPAIQDAQLRFSF